MYSNYGKVYKKQDLYDYNTYKIHSMCDYLIIVDNVVKLTNLIKYLKDNNKKYFILGNGSNIILPDHYKGVVIKPEFNEITIDKNKIISGSSNLLINLSKEAINHNLTGLEWASGIPGSLGASIIGNAGAYKDEISNYITELEVLENNKVKIIKKNDLSFSYRCSNLKTRDLIILKATLTLKPGTKEESINLVKERLEKRLATQPLEYPSAGSVFRNPEGLFAGKLIEDLGLKGYQIGGAQISTKHANFIINIGNATSKDIKSLIKHITKEVKKHYNIDLILEQQIIN